MSSSDVFVSYRRAHVAFAKQLSVAFAQRQRAVWIDWEDIPPGVRDFSREIAAGIEQANVFVAVLSPGFLGSEHCLQELLYAQGLNKRIIPVVVAPMDAAAVPECIRSINWVYFIPHAGHDNAFSTAFEAVIQAIDTDYDHLREHTKLLARALDWQNHDRNTSFFLSGDELDAAEQWLSKASGLSPHPVDVHTQFILRSRQWQTRRQRRVLGGALVLLALAVVGLIVAVVAGIEARTQQLIAERRAAETLSLAATNIAAETVANGNYLEGLSLAHFAATFSDDPPAQVRQTLQQLAFQPGVRLAFFDQPAPAMSALGLAPGQVARSSGAREHTLTAEDEATYSIRNADGAIVARLSRLIGPPFGGLGVVAERIDPAVVRRYDNPLVRFSAMDISIDGSEVAVGTEQGLVIVGNTQTVPEQMRPEGHSLPVDGVRFSSDGRYLVSRGSTDNLRNSSVIDREFIVWDTNTWQPVRQFNGFKRQRDLVAFSEDGLHLLFRETSPPGYTLWDVRDSRLVWSIQGGLHVMELAFAPNGESIVAATLLTLRMRPPRDFGLYDLDGNRINSFGGQPGSDAIDAPILFSPDGEKLRLIRSNGNLIEVNLRSGEENGYGTLPHADIAGGSANGRFIALNDHENRVVVVWDIEAAMQVGRFDDADLGSRTTLSDDGRYAAYSPFEGPLIVRDLTDEGAEVARFDAHGGSSDFVGAVVHAFGPRSETLLYSDKQGNVRMVQTGSWTERAILRGLGDTISAMAVSADGTLVAAVGEAGRLMIWDAHSGAALQRMDDVGTVAKVAFSPDGEAVLTGDEKGLISLWRLTDADDVLAWVAQHRATVPVSCEDLLQTGIVATQSSCPFRE